MGGQELVVHAWKEWGVQALVLVSLALQVALLFLAELRRRVRSGALMFFGWTAYTMADATAIYVLGHMSVSSSRSAEQQLVAFWAPFLLLHLGGQDNMTSYAIEDNRLWGRHLQALAVQATAAAYVLYESSIFTGGQPLIRWATVLMFLVAAVKYGERVRALWCASRSPAGNNYYNPSAAASVVPTVGSPEGRPKPIMELAHEMLDVPERLLKGSRSDITTPHRLNGQSLYKVVEMQLSLMHDVFYTKAEVIHRNWYGIWVRMVSAAATAAALVLLIRFLAQNDGNNRVDVAVTYVLLVGAVVLETLSLLRAAFSSWAVFSSNYEPGLCDFLCYCCCFRCIEPVVRRLRSLVHAEDWRGRGWSASMGQHNLLQLSARRRASRSSAVARRMGLEDPWNTLAYSWSTPVSEFIEDRLMNQLFQQKREELSYSEEVFHQKIKRRGKQAVLDVSEAARGPYLTKEEAEQRQLVWGPKWRPAEELFDSKDPFDQRVPKKLKTWGLYTGGLTRSIEERILAWHIATNIYLAWWYKEEEHANNNIQQPAKKQPSKINKAEAYKVEHSKNPTAEAVEALSNYMVFLLAARPDMVSPTGSRTQYVSICYYFASRGPKPETADEVAGTLLSYGDFLLVNPDRTSNSNAFGFRLIGDETSPSFALLQTGCMLGAMLIRRHSADTLVEVAQVWVETLCHAAQGCSAYAHAKHLSNGGELITVAAILLEYLKMDTIISFD